MEEDKKKKKLEELMKALLACKHNRAREDDHISFILAGAEFRELARPNVTTRSLMMNLFSFSAGNMMNKLNYTSPDQLYPYNEGNLMSIKKKLIVIGF